ncbi:hypothetical protein JW905_10455 [bacterium]|nr:hypothetical protein [candidate division CSSED10-310 bacterium]
MQKGIIKICNTIRYQILATRRTDPVHGELVADLDLEELESRIRVFRDGEVEITGPNHSLILNLTTGRMEFK